MAAAAEQHGQNGSEREEENKGVGEEPLLTMKLVEGMARPEEA